MFCNIDEELAESSLLIPIEPFKTKHHEIEMATSSKHNWKSRIPSPILKNYKRHALTFIN
uniref:Uncharacterized protein n=1 Tax=Rhizophora mucronata TaxID=61149 RepID=A0A2P2PCP3_RHIMU